MPMEQNEFTGSLEEKVELEQFSKEFLIELMGLWRRHYETFTHNLVKIGSELVGEATIADLTLKVQEATAPPIMEKIAELAKVDTNTMVGRMKAGCLVIDNIPENYRGNFEVISDNEVLLKYDHCIIMDERRVGGLDELRFVCEHMEPRYAKAILDYPNSSLNINIEMLKIPDSMEPTPGEPVCVWRFTLDPDQG